MVEGLAGTVDPKLYRVGAGDLLQLQLWGNVSRSFFLEVGPEGFVALPGAGTLRVDGRTLADVHGQVLDRMHGQLRGVKVDLRLARPRTFKIYLTGEAAAPGPMVVSAVSRVADAVAAGGLQQGASQRRIEVQHRDGTREVADVGLFLRTGDDKLNPWLQDGDVLYVPVATDFVEALGAVARPGRFELGPRDSLLTLLKLAGEPIPAADAERVLLLRWREDFRPESLWVRLADIYTRAMNPELREGDRLYLYFIPRYHLQEEATISGEVARPGVYPIVEGRHRLSDLVAAAGGFLRTADLSSIRINRRVPPEEKDPELERLLRLSRQELTSTEYVTLRTKLAGLREEYRVDWNRLTAAKAERDPLLRNGDQIRVGRLVSSIRIDGEVRRPGILAFRTGRKVQDYVNEAGGFTDRAWRSHVRVTRAVTGQTLPARNVKTLDPGDFVWVPDKRDVTPWDQVREVLTALAQIATVIIAIRSVQ
jgi:protein involved in polysaccharide export with SLBB domain